MMRRLAIAAGLSLVLAAPAFAQASFAELAHSSGMPQVPGLTIVYLSPLGDPALAPWKNIIVHQTEGPAGSAHAMAKRQADNPKVRGVTLWVETDGTVYWSVPETAVTLHGDGANRNDNKYIPNITTYRQVIHTNSIGIEFVGNFPDVRKPPSEQQVAAWLVLGEAPAGALRHPGRARLCAQLDRLQGRALLRGLRPCRAGARFRGTFPATRKPPAPLRNLLTTAPR